MSLKNFNFTDRYNRKIMLEHDKFQLD